MLEAESDREGPVAVPAAEGGQLQPVLVAEPDREGPIAVPAEEGGQLQPVPVHHHQAAGDEDQHQVNSEAELHQPFQFLVVNNILDTIPVK